VAERRAEHYAEIGEEAVRQIRMEKILEQMRKDGICMEELLRQPHGLGSINGRAAVCQEQTFKYFACIFA